VKTYMCTFLDPTTFEPVKKELIDAKGLMELLVIMNRKAREYGLLAGSYQ